MRDAVPAKAPTLSGGSVDMHVQQLSWQDQAGRQGADVGPGRAHMTGTTIAEVID